MKLLEAINRRSSTRKFSDKEITKEMIETICHYGYKIPSAGALYPLELFYVKDLEYETLRISNTRNNLCVDRIITKLPNVYVICADFDKTCSKYGERGVRYVYMEAGHMAQNICLVCEELGLGSCCVGAFDEKEVKQRYNLKFDPIYMIAIGYKDKMINHIINEQNTL